jgi:hypothetical protein
LYSSVELSEDSVNSKLYNEVTALRRIDVPSMKRASPQQARARLEEQLPNRRG